MEMNRWKASIRRLGFTLLRLLFAGDFPRGDPTTYVHYSSSSQPSRFGPIGTLSTLHGFDSALNLSRPESFIYDFHGEFRDPQFRSRVHSSAFYEIVGLKLSKKITSNI
jgi:hypothetical protein